MAKNRPHQHVRVGRRYRKARFRVPQDPTRAQSTHLKIFDAQQRLSARFASDSNTGKLCRELVIGRLGRTLYKLHIIYSITVEWSIRFRMNFARDRHLCGGRGVLSPLVLATYKGLAASVYLAFIHGPPAAPRRKHRVTGERILQQVYLQL